MSEKYSPKDGERVRVVLEGEVRDIGSAPSFVIGSVTCPNRIFPGAPHVVSVEKLPDPIPTTKDTVLWIAGSAFHRQVMEWSSTHSTLSFSDKHVQSLANEFGFTVLREGKP